MSWNLGVGVQGKAVRTGTVGSFVCRAFPFRAKARANLSYLLSSPLPKDDPMLDGGGQDVSGFGFVVEQRIISGVMAMREGYRLDYRQSILHDAKAVLQSVTLCSGRHTCLS